MPKSIENILRLTEQMDWAQQRIAVQTALLLGFRSEAAKFPVVSLEDYVEGNGSDIDQFLAQLCEESPNLSHFCTWARCLQDMTDSFAMQNLDGQLSYLKVAEQ